MGELKEIINLAPHDIKIMWDGKEVVTYPESGKTARVKTAQEQIGVIDGVPVSKTVFGEVEGLPNPQEGVYLIVSILVLQALPERALRFEGGKLKGDLIAPDTTPQGAVRDEEGKIVGVKGFQTV